jgi:conjugative relaxase-like TrwC/TraI family protein
MLSIGRMGKGQESYYLALAREDYYLGGGEPPGSWWGSTADALGLRGIVDQQSLQWILRGYDPSGRPLVQNAGKPTFRPGFDLTFSAPKSVSVLWSQADPATRGQIQEAHAAATREALRYLEDEAALSRRGKGGVTSVRAGLVAALFEHGTSRALDPQLHTHCLVANVSVGADGRTATIDARPIYAHKMAAGALYRSELGHQLTERLGVALEQVETWFEIKGVPEDLCEHFSKRRAVIEEHLRSGGLESASAAAFATLATREIKDFVLPREELLRSWAKEGEERGFYRAHLKTILGVWAGTKRVTIRELVGGAAKLITESESHFSEKDMLRSVAEASQAHGFSARELRDGVKRELVQSPDIVRLGELNGEMRFSTCQMFELERGVLRAAERLHAEQGRFASSEVIEQMEGKTWKIKTGKSKRRIKLSAEQADAFRHLTGKGSRIRILEGLAGTGKTATLRAVREAWEKSGYMVLGITLAGKARKELENGSGIKSITLRMFELLTGPKSIGRKLRHHARQLARAAAGKKTWTIKPLSLDKKTILVVDEAGMIGTQEMDLLLRAVEKGGATLILVGDRGQLQPLGAGAPLAHLADRLGKADLSDIGRQQDERDRDIVRAFAAGRVEPALEDLAKRGLLTVQDHRDAAIDALIDAWRTNESQKPDEALIFCGTNREANTVNRRCQDVQRRAHLLDRKKKIRVEDGYLFRGDRVLLTVTDRLLGVNNGETGTITSVNALRKRIRVKLDDGRRVVIPLRTYDGVRLGYAVTTHKGQGTTVESAYVLAGGFMQDREISYVQMSRARGATRVFVDRNEAGPDLSNLARQMETSRAKDLAHDILDSARQVERGTRVFQHTR